jgi:hypothetical protein
MQAPGCFAVTMFMKGLTVTACLAVCGQAAAVTCLPAEANGSGSHAVLEFNAAGAAVAWWCPDRFRPKLTLYAVRWEALTPTLHAELNALWRAADKSAAIKRLQERHADTPLTSAGLREVWSPALDRVLAMRPANPEWVAAVDGGFVLSEGRIVSDPVPVRAGMTCDCAKDATRVTVDQNVYCPAMGTQRLALCVPHQR